MPRKPATCHGATPFWTIHVAARVPQHMRMQPRHSSSLAGISPRCLYVPFDLRAVVVDDILGLAAIDTVPAPQEVQELARYRYRWSALVLSLAGPRRSASHRAALQVYPGPFQITDRAASATSVEANQSETFQVFGAPSFPQEAGGFATSQPSIARLDTLRLPHDRDLIERSIFLVPVLYGCGKSF